MKNNKGQALVEFIMIFPIFIIIIMAIVDLGSVIINKYTLENNLDLVVEYYSSGEIDKLRTYTNNNNLTYTKTNLKDDLVEVKVEKDVNTTAPIMSQILGKNFKIDASRQVYEKK